LFYINIQQNTRHSQQQQSSIRAQNQ